MAKLTKEQFVNQFPLRVDITTSKYQPVFDGYYEGVEVYRLLNLLLIKLGDYYYCRG